MIDSEYLHQGVSGLAHAHKAGTMAGHLGAAVVAGYFVGEDLSDLPDAVFRGIGGELKRVIAGEEAIWWNAKKAGVTPADLFTALPEEKPDPDSIKSIADALEKNVAQLRQSGHNVIFASLALRALHDHADLATPAVIAGVVKLTLGFNTAHPGRLYFGKEKGWKNGDQVEPPADDTFRPYASVQQMVDTTIGELIATAGVHKQGVGGLWHLINHAAGVCELHRLGYKELAKKALPAHHQHVRLWRMLPDLEAELGKVTKADHDPREADYWKGMLKRDEARLTHRIKTLFGYHTLRRQVEKEATRKAADDAFLYLMA